MSPISQKKWFEIILEEDIEIAEKAFMRTLKADRSYERKYRIRTKAGETLWIKDRDILSAIQREKLNTSAAFILM